LKHSAAVKQSIVTLDLEGVLVPEIWIAVAEKTGIRELRLTTRDVPDYDVLMKGRLNILDQHGLTRVERAPWQRRLTVTLAYASVLVTLLLANMIVNESLPVISDPILGGGVQSVIVSTVLIVM